MTDCCSQSAEPLNMYGRRRDAPGLTTQEHAGHSAPPPPQHTLSPPNTWPHVPAMPHICRSKISQQFWKFPSSVYLSLLGCRGKRHSTMTTRCVKLTPVPNRKAQACASECNMQAVGSSKQRIGLRWTRCFESECEIEASVRCAFDPSADYSLDMGTSHNFSQGVYGSLIPPAFQTSDTHPSCG